MIYWYLFDKNAYQIIIRTKLHSKSLKMSNQTLLSEHSFSSTLQGSFGNWIKTRFAFAIKKHVPQWMGVKAILGIACTNQKFIKITLKSLKFFFLSFHPLIITTLWSRPYRISQSLLCLGLFIQALLLLCRRLSLVADIVSKGWSVGCRVAK